MAYGHDPDLSLHDLRVLSVLLDERNLTRAAQSLDSSQPAISKILKRLRLQLRDPLFVRIGHSMQPTAKAVEMLAPLRSLLTAADGLRSSAGAFDARTSDRVFNLLVTDVGMSLFLPPLIGRIAERAPKVRLRALPLGSRQFEGKLETGEADLALGAFPKAAHRLRRQRLYFDGYVSVVRGDHPRYQRLRSRDAFLSERHIVVTASETGHAAHRGLQQALEAEIPNANVLLRVPSFIASAIVAVQTQSVATLPAKLADVLAGPLGLVAFQPPLALPRIEITQYWHERWQRDAGHRWLRSLIFELFGNRGP